jgi:hypothetical protein
MPLGTVAPTRRYARPTRSKLRKLNRNDRPLGFDPRESPYPGTQVISLIQDRSSFGFRPSRGFAASPLPILRPASALALFNESEPKPILACAPAYRSATR